jgi:hypothetical protein
MLRGYALWMMVCILAVSLLLPSHPLATVQAQEQPTLAQFAQLTPQDEAEPNDSISDDPASDEANPIGPGDAAATPSWRQTITGRIDPAEDEDWYRFEVSEPGSAVLLTLSDLPADYDLVLVNGPDVVLEGDAGLENVLDTRGRARSSRGRARSSRGRARSSRGRARSSGDGVNAIRGRARSSGGTLNAISAEAGTTAEEIESILWLPGTYYIAVVGDNGATSGQPYTLDVEVSGSDLAYNLPPLPSVSLQLPTTPPPAIAPEDVRTLFVVNSQRMKERYPADDATVDEITAQIDDVRLRPEVSGVVLDVGSGVLASTTLIANAYALWDSDPTNPFYANYVAQIYNSVVTAAAVRNPSSGSGPPLYPNIEYIVLVGGDEVIPFYRVPDLATVANQREYLPYLDAVEAEEGNGSTGVVRRDSPLWGALNHGTLLTDDIYGDAEPYQLPYHLLFVPDRAVGRLVETPGEVLAYLTQYSTAGDNAPLQIDATENGAVVSGYDFLTNQAEALQARFALLGIEATALINDTWTTVELENVWFGGDFAGFRAGDYTTQSPFALQSVNGHFDHMWAIPADESQPRSSYLRADSIFAPEPASGSARYFRNRVCYSVGCHSGLNVAASSVEADADPLYQADFPQAFLKQGGNWIGNTGYGYGDADTVGYSERLSVFFTEELGRDVRDADDDYIGQPIGTAMARAKQRYIRNATFLDVHDVKSLMVWTLYGLPFLRVTVDEPQPPLSDELQPDTIPASIDNTLGLSERIVTFTTSIDNGGSLPVLDGVAVEDSFVQAGFSSPAEPRIIEAAQAGYPDLPEFAYPLSVKADSGLENVLVKDVVFMGGSYRTLDAYQPRVSQIVTQDLDLLPAEPLTFEAGAETWYPELLFEHSNTALYTDTEIARRDQMLVIPAQFRADAAGEQGTLRLYEQMVFKVLYLDPEEAPPASVQDTTPPLISAVRVLDDDTAVQASGITLLAEISDDVSPDEALQVQGAYIEGDAWVPFSFQEDTTRGFWRASLPGDASVARYIISARDQAGNVSTYTGKGDFAAPSGEISSIKLEGPRRVELESTATYIASVEPATAAQPLSYQWSPEPDAGQGTPAATYSFPSDAELPASGLQTIRVTVANMGGSVSRDISVQVGTSTVYLPLVQR